MQGVYVRCISSNRRTNFVSSHLTGNESIQRIPKVKIALDFNELIDLCMVELELIFNATFDLFTSLNERKKNNFKLVG